MKCLQSNNPWMLLEAVMFSTAGLFSSIPCPDKKQCKRSNCVYSHDVNAKNLPLPQIPVSSPVAGPSTTPHQKVSPAKPSRTSAPLVPAKRQSAVVAKSYAITPNVQASSPEPPRKFQRVADPVSKVPTASTSLTTVFRRSFVL